MSEETTGKTIKLAKASHAFNATPEIVAGLQTELHRLGQLPYQKSIELCRYYYRRDGIASTVINRTVEIIATQIRNKRRVLTGEGDISDAEFELFKAVAKRIQPYIQTIALSYLIDGMAIPQYEITRIMGNRLSSKLGRTRYYMPESVWCRNPEHIILKRTLVGGKRRAYIQIPSQDQAFIANKGIWADGAKDTETYERIKEELPEYVAAIERGETIFPVDNFIIYRKLLPFNDYPLPYLEGALNALDHKRYLKTMDRSIATRAIEAFRHVKVGNDEYPADQEDIEATQSALNQRSSTDRVYNLFTNHTVQIEWVTPPLDIIMNEGKYVEANSDIFFALGFPRILTVGETEKSNAADNKIAALGILATLKTIQTDILEWVKQLYTDIAEKNDLKRVPEPYFAAIPLADVTQLIQYSRDMLEMGVVSRDTIAAFYGTDFDSEHEQTEYEDEIVPPAPILTPVAQKVPSANNQSPQEPTASAE